MQELTRRGALTVGATAVTAGITGCAGGGRRGEEVANTTVGLVEDEYHPWTLSLDEPGTLEYEFAVTEGTTVDIILLTDGQYETYKKSTSFDYVEDGSTLASAGDEVTVELSAGEYVLVADNSKAGRATPVEGGGNESRVEMSASVVG